MIRCRWVVCTVFLVSLLVAGVASAVTPTPTQEKYGGSIFFDTSPTDATIWLDGAEKGNSPFTFFSEKNASFSVRVSKKGYQDYTDTISVSDGKRVVFNARLTLLPSDLEQVTTTSARVVTVPTIPRSTMKVPTPWPTTSPASPADPVIPLGAAVLGAAFIGLRRR
jgi:hypothetical protein